MFSKYSLRDSCNLKTPRYENNVEFVGLSSLRVTPSSLDPTFAGLILADIDRFFMAILEQKSSEAVAYVEFCQAGAIIEIV